MAFFLLYPPLFIAAFDLQSAPRPNVAQAVYDDQVDSDCQQDQHAQQGIYPKIGNQKNKITAEKKRLSKFYASSSATMAENDVDVTIKKYVQFVKQETELLEEYNKKFREVLPAHKVMKLYLAEFQFREWLLRQIKERKLNNDEDGV